LLVNLTTFDTVDNDYIELAPVAIAEGKESSDEDEIQNGIFINLTHILPIIMYNYIQCILYIIILIRHVASSTYIQYQF
jgi:hypothetical protein